MNLVDRCFEPYHIEEKVLIRNENLFVKMYCRYKESGVVTKKQPQDSFTIQ